jgi:molybdenum cofactor guanylyltransferase
LKTIVDFDPVTAEQICQQKLGNNLIVNALLRQYQWQYCGAIILAGGNSLRMGTNKALLLDPRFREDEKSITLIASLVENLKRHFSQVYISAKKQTDYIFDVPIIADQNSDCGPLMGIYSGLQATSKAKNFVIATDIPVIDLQCIQQLLYYADNYDIVVPENNGQLEPLYAIYSKHLSAKIAELLARGEKKVSALFNQCETKIIAMKMPWYKNLNTREDYEEYFNSSR